MRSIHPLSETTVRARQGAAGCCEGGAGDWPCQTLPCHHPSRDGDISSAEGSEGPIHPRCSVQQDWQPCCHVCHFVLGCHRDLQGIVLQCHSDLRLAEKR